MNCPECGNVTPSTKTGVVGNTKIMYFTCPHCQGSLGAVDLGRANRAASSFLKAA